MGSNSGARKLGDSFGNVACGGPGGVDGVFVTSLRLSCDEGLGNQEADEAVISASPADTRSPPVSLISSSENPLHSPSDSSLDEDADDLLGDDDGYCITPVECGGLENTPKPSALDSTVDFLYGQNPLLSPSSSMAASSMELDRDESLGAGEVVSVQLDKVMEEQKARRAELESYMVGLRESKTEDGDPAVLLPTDFMRMVGEILEENRPRGGEKDWLTIAREEAAIVARENAAMPMPMWTKVKTEDPKTLQALNEAIALDKKLREKQIEAMIVWRETHPDQWEEQRQKKEEERRKMAEKAIRAERKRRQHQARLQRAMHSAQSFDRDDHMARNTHLGPAARYFKLQPEEEELVERLLKEGDEDGMAGNDGLSTSNPFDLQLVAVGGAAESQGFDMARDTIKQMAAIESQLSGLAQDHLFDEAGSLIDFRSLASGRDGAATERPASASTRLTEETSAPPAPVPVAAAPSVGGASPPSAASGRGEGSRKPAGAYGERSAAGSVVSTQSHSVVRDFLTEQRLQREAAERERQLDARIRQLRVSELPGPREIKPGELEALIADCRRAQEALDSRMDAINRMDAGTPFPQALLPGPVALDGVGKSGAAGHHHAGRRVYSRTALAGRRSSSPGDESTSGAHRNSRRSGEGASGRSSREWSQDEGVGGSGRPSSGREQREESIGQGSFAAGTSNQRGPESSVASWTGPPDEHNGPLPGSPGPRRPQGTPRQGLAEPIKGSRPWTPSATGPRPPASASGHRESPPTPPPSRPRSTSSALMTSGPKRSLAERQRRSSDAGRALLAVDGEVKEGKTVILHGKAPPRTPTRSGRRSRDGGTSQGGAEAAEGPPPSTPPHPTLKVDPLQDLGADKVMKRVPSAGRRAGISARP